MLSRNILTSKPYLVKMLSRNGTRITTTDFLPKSWSHKLTCLRMLFYDELLWNSSQSSRRLKRHLARMCQYTNYPGFYSNTVRKFSTTAGIKNKSLPFEVAGNVQKDVLLYSNNNKKYYKYLSWFGFIQFGFWSYLAQFSYSSLRDVKLEEEKNVYGQNVSGEKTTWWRKVNLGENKYRNGITLLCLTIGYTLFAFTILFPLRSVHRVILLRGGEKVAMQTFAPLGNLRTLTVPIEYISANQSRQAAKASLALKLKGRWFFFLLDQRGKYHNTKLFDYVVALKRTF